MTQAYTGMRKGISLVEMVIAIVLFAVLATIGLKYAKSYLNTDLQAKKARVAALTDQANQLTQAYAIYRVETGMDPTAISDLNGSAAILNSIPFNITEISKLGWDINISTGFPGSGFAFTLNVDANGSANADELHCAIFNREFNTSTELNVSDNQDFGTAAAQFAALGNNFCYGTGTGIQIMIVVP